MSTALIDPRGIKSGISREQTRSICVNISCHLNEKVRLWGACGPQNETKQDKNCQKMRSRKEIASLNYFLRRQSKRDTQACPIYNKRLAFSSISNVDLNLASLMTCVPANSHAKSTCCSTARRTTPKTFHVFFSSLEKRCALLLFALLSLKLRWKWWEKFPSPSRRSLTFLREEETTEKVLKVKFLLQIFHGALRAPLVNPHFFRGE